MTRGENMRTLAKRVKLKLIRSDMTQKELADILEVSYDVLNGVVNGSLSSLKVELKILEWLDKK